MRPNRLDDTQPRRPVSPGEADLRPARRRQRERADGRGVYLPAWSVVAMLVIVLAVAGGLIGLFLLLGGNQPPDPAPRIVIVTAIPSPTPAVSATPQAILLTPPTAAPATTADGTPSVPQFALEGPLLPTAAISPTPDSIAVGKTVQVINVGESELNVRGGAGIGNNVLFTAPLGTRFEVIGGPQSADGLTWWQVRGVTNPAQTGWAAENNGEQDLLRVAAP